MEPIDWAGRWRALVEAREAQAGRHAPPHDAGYWDRRAAATSILASAADPATDPVLATLLELLHPGETVVDVGAGGGRYAVPLARHGARVTAVEPSSGMATRLRNLAEEHAVSIELRHQAWESSDARGDVVLCANVLTPIADGAGFIRRLAQAADRLLIIVLRQTPLDERTHVGPLWKLLYGEDRVPEPSALDCLNLCWQLALPAELRLVTMPGTPRFRPLEDVRFETFLNLMLPTDAAGPLVDQVDAYLATQLLAADGLVALPAPPMRYGIITVDRTQAASP